MSPDLNVREKQQVNVGPAESTTDKIRFVPRVDIWESDQGLTVVAELPGVTQENLSLDLQNNTLTISGQVGSEVEGRKSLLKEFEIGGFYRQFALAENIDQAAIGAALKDGVLTLTLPKIAPAQPRKIEVKEE